MLKDFRAYQLSVEFYKQAIKLQLPYHLKEQIRRAASSICLNLGEGSGRETKADQRRFYTIAFGSLREVQAIIDLSNDIPKELQALLDKIGACIYKLIQSRH